MHSPQSEFSKIFTYLNFLLLATMVLWSGCTRELETILAPIPDEQESLRTALQRAGEGGRVFVVFDGEPDPDIIVTTTSDVADFGGSQNVGDLPGLDGVVSLREAILAANNTAGPQVIAFNIPTSDPGFNETVFTIKPQSTGLPALQQSGTIIDGTTQTLFSGDTNPLGPEIVLDGSEAGPSFGILIPGSSINNTIRGIVIHSFAQTGVQVDGPSEIVQCYIGTNETGSVALGNGWQGIAVTGTGTIIRENLISGNATIATASEIQVSGPEGDLGGNTVIEENLIGTDRTGTVALGSVLGVWLPNTKDNIIKGNLISGNESGGIGITGNSTSNLIEENLIGTDITGNNPLPNKGGGIDISTAGATNNIVKRNTIAFNDIFGISVNRDATTNTISHNSIFSNQGLGIDLAGPGGCCPDGVTQNDAGDIDIGSNNLMNFPVLTSAKTTPGKLIVKGTIDTPNPRSVIVEFFANPVPDPGGDPSGHGEGAIFLGSKWPNPQGKFTATLPSVSPGTLIAATATDAAGNTSEFSANIEAKAPGQ